MNQELANRTSDFLRRFVGHTARLLDEWGNSRGRQQALRAAVRLLDGAEASHREPSAAPTPIAFSEAVTRLVQQLGSEMQYEVATDHIRFTCINCMGSDAEGPDPFLCHLWWESLRRMAAEYFGYGQVVVTQPDLGEHAGCYVRLYLQPAVEVEEGAASPVAVRRPARGRPPDRRAREVGIPQAEPSAEATIGQLQEKVRYLEQRTKELETALEERKVIEKAKGVLMERLRISEPEAMRKLQQESQIRNKKLAELARIIVAAGEMM